MRSLKQCIKCLRAQVTFAKLVIAALLIGAGSYVWKEKPFSPVPETLNVRLNGGKGDWDDMIITIPSKYVGPDSLNLSRRIRKNEQRTKILPVAVTHDMQAVPETIRETGEGGIDRFLSVYAYKSYPPGVRNFASGLVGRAEPQGQEFGLLRYKNKRINETLYYHRADENKPEYDVLLICYGPQSPSSSCRYYISTGQLWLEFSYLREKLANWRGITDKIRAFMMQFPMRTESHRPEWLDQVPDIIPFELYQMNAEYLGKYINTTRFNLPKAFIWDATFADGIDLPLRGGTLLLDVEYPSMTPLARGDEAIKPEEFYLRIKVEKWKNRAALSKLVANGQYKNVADWYERNAYEQGEKYGLDYFALYPKAQRHPHIYRKRGKQSEDTIHISCEFPEDTRFCKMGFIRHGAEHIEVSLPFNQLEKWPDILSKVDDLLNSIRERN